MRIKILIIILIIKLVESFRIPTLSEMFRMKKFRIDDGINNGINDDEICNILVLSGGGSHGAYQAGVIKNLTDNNNNYDVITGISAGSLNAGYISLYEKEDIKTASNNLIEMWSKLTNDKVYNINLFPFNKQSVFDNTPLRNTLNDIISNFTLPKRNIIIGATSLTTGKQKIYTERNMKTNNDMTNILLSSTAIPIIFPPNFYDNDYLVDGGLFSNELIDPAIDRCIADNKNNIKIDVILCAKLIDEILVDDIKNMGLGGLMSRTFDILDNTYFNHELYSRCELSQKIYPMNIYLPNEPFPTNIINFNPEYSKIMINMGIQNKYSLKHYYCR
jgi:predicted patatin/cPLA2 family phospholipase